MRAPLNTILAIICSLLLQACGGGGGGGDGGGPSPQATNKAPTLSINAQIDVLEGTAAVATATATDPENQTMTFSLSPSADSDLFDISASGALRFLTAPDFETPADANSGNDYELSVTVSDSQNASDSQNVTVTVTNAIEGRVIDAPLSGSEIYIVTTGASAASAGDSVGTSDAQGYFFIPAPADTSNVQIMTRGGTDTETGVAMPDLMLMADLPTDADASIAVTPISTVVANADTAEDKQAVLTALGITGTVDAFLSKDIWKEAKEGNSTAQSLQSTNAQIGLLISTAQSLVDDGTMAQLSEVADKVAEKIAEKASANEAIDLQADTMISEVLSDALSTMSVESTAIDAVSSNIAEINELLADGDVDPTSADAADFIEKAQTELQDAVKDLASGDTSVNDFATETAMATLFANNAIFNPQANAGGNTNTETNDSVDDLLVFTEGAVASIWNKGINAFDEDLSWGDCNQSGGATCQNIGWELVNDTDRGQVLQVTHSSAGKGAGLFFQSSGSVDLSDYATGAIEFDIKVISGDSAFTMKIDCGHPCSSGEQTLGSKGATGWEAVSIPLSSLTTLDLTKVNSPLVIWATQHTNTVFQLDNVRFTGIADGATAPTGSTGGSGPTDYEVVPYGAGSIADTIYTASHRCKQDHGFWVENAGVISTQSDIQALGCNQNTGEPTGNITKLYPQLTGPAAEQPTQTHKWWGSVSFLGEMTVGDEADAAHITPDPITARITDKGVRVMGIPAGLKLMEANKFYYPIPNLGAEVFDGIAVGNSAHSNLKAYTKDHSEGSVTVMWKSGSTEVMEATFVHGSPYIYFKAYSGNFEIRTQSQDGFEKGTFSDGDNMLGVWTNVAENINNYLIVGEGATTFTNLSSNAIGVNNAAKEMTLVYLPHLEAGTAPSAMIDLFASKARNTVASVDIDYQVNNATNEVTVTHSYLDNQGNAVDTIAGMHPLHWKNTSQATTSYKIRSSRGMVKFAEVEQFSYQLPYVGVLPTLPVTGNSLDRATLEGLVTDFIDQGSATWNTDNNGVENTDTYWSGKSYGKVAELAAIADSLDMQDEANQLISWLKVELEDWFTAETAGTLNTKKYFVYDDDWNTLFGFDESYGSHQRIADHHFHYGYFVRAAAEICRVEPDWCGEAQYGPMIELLIRDYAADKDDLLFPHMRNFDPANGFSWADGQVNFMRGNNNESTSEAATAYGAIILYGLATGNTELTERGIYLHASTGAAYWEYWNNIDGYNNVGADADNFFDGYDRITTSIIWGNGADFATWFSDKFAHILGIQGLPSSPLILHVGLYSAYMADYVALGLSQSSNNKPSGLLEDQWRDLWWNLWAMVDAEAAIADYNSVSSYTPEAGESKAHTYHWLHTFNALGQLQTGTGALTANHPAALAFDKDGVRSYVVYNFTDQTINVSYSDGKTVSATPGFTVTQ